MNLAHTLSRPAPWLALALISCGQKPSAPASSGDADAALAASVASALDTSADPCADFYQYACGGWLKTTEIPADRVMWSRSFSSISLRNEELLRGILEEAAKSPGEDATKQKLGAYYGACMDEASIEAKGLGPVEPLLAEIEKAATPADFARLAATLHIQGMAPFFDFGIFPDFKDPSLNILHMSQGGLGLPDREYYLKDDETSKGLRTAYASWLGRVLALSGTPEDEARDLAAKILAFETELARVSLPREQLYDPSQTYHRLERTGLQALAPEQPWDAFFEALGQPGVSAINVEVPAYYAALPKILAGAEPEALRAYLRVNVLRGNAIALPSAIEQEVFAFYGRTLMGQPEMKPRWRRCVDATQGAMGELLGQAYVAAAFAGDSKATAEEMIRGIESAFEGGLGELAWMDEETRARATEKARAVTNKIGYPDRWRDYGGLQISAGEWYASQSAAKRFNADYELAKIGKPVDRGEWYMPPQLVNAYYNPLNNEIVFPAGILQPPFFSAAAPKSMNYGAIGAIMGHELSHGFDDDGRKFDPQGRMVEWWNPEAVTRFEEAAACVSTQYSGYTVQEGLNVNGELTLGENIADMGGIKATLRAWRAWTATHGAEPGLAGLSGEQLLFVSYAQSWCSLIRPETERMLVMTDSHSPAKFRVNGPLANLPEFAAAFQCPAGAPMAPEKRCTVW